MLPKLKLRPAPPLEVLESQQKSVETLLQLNAWTEEPSKQPLEAVSGVEAPTPLPAPRKARLDAPEKPNRPWQGVDNGAVHSYNILLPKALQAKLDFVWKRKDCKSMREWVLEVLAREADKVLRELGEKP